MGKEETLIKKDIKRLFKPKYRLADILVGELVVITENKAWTEGVKNYRILEELDFFVPVDGYSSDMRELFFNKKILNIRLALTKDLAYTNPIPFVTMFSKEMLQVGLTPNTKLTVEELWKLKVKLLEKVNSRTKSF